MGREASHSRTRRHGLELGLLLLGVFLSGFRGTRAPVQLRIEGYLDAPAEAHRGARAISVQVAKGSLRQLAVTSIVNRGSGPLGMTILDNLARYKPALRFVGDKELVARIAGAEPDQLVKMTGNLTQARYLMLSGVEILAPEAAP